MSVPAAQSLWRRALPAPLRAAAAPAMRQAIRAYVHLAGRAPTPKDLSGLPIRIVGFFDSTHGVGASARLVARALESLGAPVERISLTGATADWGRRLARPTPAAAWIFMLNAPELVFALACLGPRQVVGPRYGYWAWELPRGPAGWMRDARLVDEVWAISRYTAEAFAQAEAPVRAAPLPLFAQDYDGIAPAPRDAAFQAVALFDFNSSAARKNPQGAIEAFRRAFGDDPTCELVVKTQNAEAFPELAAALCAAAPGNVRFVDASWPYAQVKALIAGADVLVSMHRAEGFGLPMAEAMALGTPVVATAFSGNLDFMDDGCALLVPSRPAPVDDPQGIYRGQAWAEPDLDAAAAALRRLRAEPDLRAALADAGRRKMAETLSPAAWLGRLPPAVQATVRWGH